MANELLPNGSIVLLEGGNKKLMIYGRKQLLVDDEQLEDEEEATMYDYLGVPYPAGYINPEYTYVFNHSDIVEVIFKGFSNEEEERFQNILNRLENLLFEWLPHNMVVSNNTSGGDCN